MKQSSQQALAKLSDVTPMPFETTTHPGAQWFPEAGFGLFVHWGIHSVAGIEPSWSMMKNCPWQQEFYDVLGWSRYLGKENYYQLTTEFDPQNYDPDKWLMAAADAGMKYVVMTTKHHDGYALWPSEYGELGTKQHLAGRDLIEPFVAACRKHDLKIGFYFSPRDWGYPGYPQSMDFAEPWEFPEDWTEERNLDAFERFYEYTTGQLSELLTRYGDIDLMWFDGMGWKGVTDIRTNRTLTWIRELQPHIVINPRWDGVGDFETVEGWEPGAAPEGWWEHCVSWSGHWGYSPHAPFMSNSWVMAKLAKIKSWGGNFLLNIGPAADGTMRPEYYEGLSHIAQWMDCCGEALIDVSPVSNWHQFSNVPITRRGDIWYLHVLPAHEGQVVVEGIPRPMIESLNHGVSLTNYAFDDDAGRLTISVSMTMRDDLNNVFKIYWDG